jgi:hypothetical protein
VTLARLTARPLRPGTYILEVAALDPLGAPASSQHIKFWVLKGR